MLLAYHDARACVRDTPISLADLLEVRYNLVETALGHFFRNSFFLQTITSFLLAS